MRWMVLFVALAGLGGLCGACKLRNERPSAPSSKIELDLTQLDSEGLRGPPGGKASIAYEFRIPDSVECRTEVKAIDPSIQFMPGSSGRIGAGNGQCLCVGSTGENYREILGRLAALPYIDRIIACDFE